MMAHLALWSQYLEMFALKNHDRRPLLGTIPASGGIAKQKGGLPDGQGRTNISTNRSRKSKGSLDGCHRGDPAEERAAHLSNSSILDNLRLSSIGCLSLEPGWPSFPIRSAAAGIVTSR